MDMCYPRDGWQLKKKEAYSDQFLEDKSVGPSHSNRSVPRLVYCFRLQNVTSSPCSYVSASGRQVRPAVAAAPAPAAAARQAADSVSD